MKQDYYLRAELDRTRLPKNQEGKSPEFVPTIAARLPMHVVHCVHYGSQSPVRFSSEQLSGDLIESFPSESQGPKTSHGVVEGCDITSSYYRQRN